MVHLVYPKCIVPVCCHDSCCDGSFITVCGHRSFFCSLGRSIGISQGCDIDSFHKSVKRHCISTIYRGKRLFNITKKKDRRYNMVYPLAIGAEFHEEIQHLE